MFARIRAAIPPTILVLLAWMVVADLTLDAYRTYQFGTRDPAWVAIGLASSALWLVISLLLPLGLNELAQRRDGLERSLLGAAAAIAGVLAMLPIVQLYIELVATPSLSWLRSYWTWTGRFSAGGMLAVSALLAVATARRGPRGVGIGIALVVTCALAIRFETLREWLLFDDRRGDRWANLALTTLYSLAFSAALGAATFVLGDRAPPRPEEPGAISRYLEHIGTALVARVVILIGAAAFTAMAIGSRSPGLFKVVLVLAPIGVLLSMIGQLVGTFRLANLPDGPRLRLTAGASLTLATMIVSISQGVATYRLARGGEDLRSTRASELLGAWPYLAPALALLGLLLLLSGVAALRRRQPTLDAGAPTVAAAWLVVASLGAVYLQHRTPGTASQFVLLALAVAVCNVVAVLAVARVCHKTAWAFMAGEPPLPTARVVPGDRNPM